MYQIGHAETAFLKDHDGVDVDELNLSNWAHEHKIDADDLELAPFISDASDRFLYSLQYLLRDPKNSLYGKELFDQLADLEEGIGLLGQDEVRMNERPKVDVTMANVVGKVVIPKIVRAFERELPRWREGWEWNSCIRIEKGSLFILEPRRLPSNVPVNILDATANKELFFRLFSREMQVYRLAVDPPKGMRHIAVRTGKQYSKLQMVESDKREENLNRIVREAKHLLQEVKPDGKKSVGLVTYKGCKDELGDALGVPAEFRGHFGAIRGSNALESCDVLLVIGTPVPNLDSMVNLARMLYRDDRKPIDTATGEDKRYVDERLRGLIDYMVNAELTQACHRNRPLRHDERTVISMTSRDVDYLPITTLIIGFDNLRDPAKTEQRREPKYERIEKVVADLLAQGIKPSVTKIYNELDPRVRRDIIAQHLRNSRAGSK